MSLEDRIPKLKQMRKKKANRRLIILLAIFFLLIISVIYLQSPLSQVQSIDIKGNGYLSKKEIIKQSGIKINDNFWEVDTSESEKMIKKLPEVKDVIVKKQLPNSIEITLKEYQYMAYVQKGKSYYPVFSNGKILNKKLQAIPNSGPLLVQFKEGKQLKTTIEQLGELPDEIVNSISEIHHEPKKTDEYHIVLYMNDGFEVSASGETLADKLVHYPSIVSQLKEGSKGVIDLEVGSFFRSYTSESKK